MGPENYLDSMRIAGFNNPEVLQETTYLEVKTDGRIMTSLVVKAIKQQKGIQNEVFQKAEGFGLSKEQCLICMRRKFRKSIG